MSSSNLIVDSAEIISNNNNSNIDNSNNSNENLDMNDIREVTENISDLATSASALAVNAIAVAKSASQLRLNEKLIVAAKMVKDAKQRENEAELAARIKQQQQIIDSHHHFNHSQTTPMSSYSSSMHHHPNPNPHSHHHYHHDDSEVMINAPPTSSGIENTLTSISTLRAQNNNQMVPSLGHHHHGGRVSSASKVSTRSTNSRGTINNDSLITKSPTQPNMQKSNSRNKFKTNGKNGVGGGITSSSVSSSSSKEKNYLTPYESPFDGGGGGGGSASSSGGPLRPPPPQIISKSQSQQHFQRRSPTTSSTSSATTTPHSKYFLHAHPHGNGGPKHHSTSIGSHSLTNRNRGEEEDEEEEDEYDAAMLGGKVIRQPSNKNNNSSHSLIAGNKPITIRPCINQNPNNNINATSLFVNQSATIYSSNNNQKNKFISSGPPTSILLSSTSNNNNNNSHNVTNIVQDILDLHGAAQMMKSNTNTSYSNNNNKGAGKVMSRIEEAILRSTDPISFESSGEEIEVNGQRGILANRAELMNWKGPMPIENYPINQDPTPEIITKRSQQQIEYVQELAIRYLKPPTPPAPGEIIIQQMPNVITPPAPPIVIRQQPPRPETPEPLVIREAPPPPPEQIGRRIITISGQKLPPPPRKVVIERLAPLPSKPQSVIIERWLPYPELKRRVIYKKPMEADAQVITPKNVIIQWDPPSVQIKKEYKYLGVIRANPFEYVQRFKDTIRQPHELPDLVAEIPTPDGLVLAAEHKPKSLHDLEGDLEALKLVDLDMEGLGAYKFYLKSLGLINTNTNNNNNNTNSSKHTLLTSQLLSSLRSTAALTVPGTPIVNNNKNNNYNDLGCNNDSLESSNGSIVAISPNSSQTKVMSLIDRIFKCIDREAIGTISVADATAILLRLASRLNKKFTDEDLKAFLESLKLNKDGHIELEEFKRAFLNLQF